MIRFLIDADLPRSALIALRRQGYTVDDVRDLGLGAATDDVILRHARTHGYTLISGDKGFTNVLRFPLGTHHGILVARFPRRTPAREKVRLLLRWIPTLEEAGSPREPFDSPGQGRSDPALAVQLALPSTCRLARCSLRLGFSHELQKNDLLLLVHWRADLKTV